MISLVVAMNRVDVVDVVALNTILDTILALRLSKTGRTVGPTDSRLDGWSVGQTNDWSGLRGYLLSSKVSHGNRWGKSHTL